MNQIKVQRSSDYPLDYFSSPFSLILSTAAAEAADQ